MLITTCSHYNPRCCGVDVALKACQFHSGRSWFRLTQNNTPLQNIQFQVDYEAKSSQIHVTYSIERGEYILVKIRIFYQDIGSLLTCLTHRCFLYAKRTPSLHVISCLYWNWFHVPKSYISLKLPDQKNASRPMFKPYNIGKYDEIPHFFYSLIKNSVLWPKVFGSFVPKLSGS